MRIVKRRKFVKEQLHRQTRTDFQAEGRKEEKSTTPEKSGENFFSKNGKENAVDETDKNENEDVNISATVGGSADTIHQCGSCFGTSRQQLAPVTFSVVENQSFDAKIAVANESVIYDVCDHPTAMELVMSDALPDSQVGSGVGSGDVVFGLVQMRLEEPDRKKNSSLNSEAQLLHSDEKNMELSFSYAANDGTLQSNQFEKKRGWAVTDNAAKQNFYCWRNLSENVQLANQIVKFSTSRRESLVTISCCQLWGKVIWNWNFRTMEKTLLRLILEIMQWQ